jgi:hypothetical protein
VRLRPPCPAAPLGYVWQMAENEWGSAVVATALTVVDDTALTGKTIIGDIKVGVGVGLGLWG